MFNQVWEVDFTNWVRVKTHTAYSLPPWWIFHKMYFVSIMGDNQHFHPVCYQIILTIDMLKWLTLSINHDPKYYVWAASMVR
jgi:hypothetical protein